MTNLSKALAGLFLVYGISTAEGSGKIIIDLLKEVEKQYQSKEQECEELKAKLKEKDSELSKKCFELLEKKARIAQLIDENATKEVIYKINGKCAKTTANRVKERTAIVNL